MIPLSQIIYVENEYNDDINHFFMHHLESIQAIARKKGLEFVYIPQFFNDISSSGNRIEELIHYYYPFFMQPIIGSPKLDYFTTPFFTNFLLPKLGYSDRLNPGLICFRDNEFGNYTEFDLSGEQSLEEQCIDYFSKYPDVSEPIDPEPIDNVLERIINTIDKDEIERLGIYEFLLKEIGVALNTSPQKQKPQAHLLSRLVIDKEYRIGLPDYNNLEIKMTPLHKALYLLFLRHPEGILLKYMPDYKQELTTIYKQLSNRENYSNMKKSIEG